MSDQPHAPHPHAADHARLLEPTEVSRPTLESARLLPMRLVLEAPVIHFTVRDLMELAPGALVETAAQHNDDLALQVNGQLVGMAKFDVVGDVLAVRLTEVA